MLRVQNLAGLTSVRGEQRSAEFLKPEKYLPSLLEAEDRIRLFWVIHAQATQRLETG